MQDTIRIDQADNVAIALRSINRGETLDIGGNAVTAAEDTLQGHKMTIKPIKGEEEVVKCGFHIGYAKEETGAGQWIHAYNVETALRDLLKYEYQPADSGLEEMEHVYSEGFRRASNKMGVHNEVWIIPAVSCVNFIAQALERTSKKLAMGSIEDVIASPHPYGYSQAGDDQEHTRTVPADMANHPNTGGMLVLGLEHENSNIPVLREHIGNHDKQKAKFLQCQNVEGEMETVVGVLEELAVYAGVFSQEKIDTSELIVRMKCGSFGRLSGITANPIVGVFSDTLISKGGTAVSVEVSEIFGAETLLVNQRETPELFEKMMNLINDSKNYFTSHNQATYENSSPGNKKGGMSTLEDKSLGCAQKSGGALVKGVISYGEPVKTKGLNLLSMPGDDLVAVTALVVFGARIVSLTTECGIPFTSPMSTVEMSNNSALVGKKNNWIDLNAGRMVEDRSKEELTQGLFDYMIEVASGRKVKAEGVGLYDMVIFKQGVTL